MANSYVEIYIHLILGVKCRKKLIKPNWENHLYKYLNTLTSKNGHKLIRINGVEDHVHMLISMSSQQPISNFVLALKKSSSNFISKNQFSNEKFYWQEGYGAFSVSAGNKGQVIKYIENQKEHHQKLSFIEEYEVLLNLLGIDYNRKYLP